MEAWSVRVLDFRAFGFPAWCSVHLKFEVPVSRLWKIWVQCFRFSWFFSCAVHAASTAEQQDLFEV